MQNGLHSNGAGPPATGIEGKQAHDFLTEVTVSTSQWEIR